MADCGCEATPAETTAQRNTLWVALILNAAMFVAEITAGLVFNSAGLVADGLDMLSDAAAYAISLAAIGRSDALKANSALFSGMMLLILGFGLILEVVRRFHAGSSPEGGWMIGVSLVALAVNVIVLRLLSRQRNHEVHLRAAWIFTRADVIANAAVILAGIAVVLTGIRYFDLTVGAAIGLYVVREAFEILREAQIARRAA